MNWRVTLRPEVESDMAAAISWYEEKQPGLGLRFAEEVFWVWDELIENPLLISRKHPTKNIRWRFPKSFPYRIVYEVFDDKHEVVVLAVLHAARQGVAWESRSS
jgi:toxin ParE1/3/4